MNTKSQTLEITNFRGILTRENFGNINSGLSKFGTSNSYDPFTNPTNLNWNEQPIQIDPNGSVITDLIVDGVERVESGILYVYAIGHTGRVYKIQVNNPSTYNPNYDNPVLLTTITTNSPTFTMGGSITTYGATERLYIGHDKGVTQLDFNGANETFVGLLGSWTQNVPRPVVQFLGKLYYGNGSNLAEVDSSLTVTSYAKLSPGFPSNSQVRDLDVSPDGIYLESVVSQLALTSILSTTPDTSSTSNTISYVFKWNGGDSGPTSFVTYPSFSIGSNVVFGERQFVFGVDIAGATVFNPTNKIITPLLIQSPLPNTVSSNANIVGWASPEFSNGVLKLSSFLYGPLDASYPDNSWYRSFQMSATGSQTDIIRCPYYKIVSNFSIGQASNGYTGGVFSSGKTYFSTLETSPAPTTAYKFYKFNSIATGTGTSIVGVYETQNELFSKKVHPGEVRIYTEPLVTNNSFQIDLIGSNNGVISGSTKTFTVGTNVTAGQDYVWYTPQTAPTYCIGLRITNLGSANWTAVKAEIDWEYAGK